MSVTLFTVGTPSFRIACCNDTNERGPPFDHLRRARSLTASLGGFFGLVGVVGFGDLVGGIAGVAGNGFVGSFLVGVLVVMVVVMVMVVQRVAVAAEEGAGVDSVAVVVGNRRLLDHCCDGHLA